ncbi:hypothetical protein CDAR_575041 [Caerostris darwini]|uniref:Uncharacterized protein n=1 Tax=Caerostris darwini TaxID=1538125 RepID=A0AAV4SZB4_9ARAC|nr:hypothetical protein CDAR_575041 [Caerostris darwini]
MISSAMINIDCPLSRQQYSFCWCRNHKSDANSSPRNEQSKGSPPPFLCETNGTNSNLGIYQGSPRLIHGVSFIGYKLRPSSLLLP